LGAEGLACRRVRQRSGGRRERSCIRQEEQLPVYERLGDVRERAVTMGQIADILQQRGETDEALRIYTDEYMPMARLAQDMDLIAHSCFSCAQLRLNRGGLQKGEAQMIADELAESYRLNQQLQRVDGIAIVGALLGQVLAATGAHDDATAVLNVSAAAFERIGAAEQAAQIRELAAKIANQS
jgi:hypothetical protein